ncbi:CapA family protein [Thiobacillus denitrificans]|uniref:Poly-gamma-glutamate biosynthesis protein n=1 Tax=Thiobacillus denitrificans TaxID=36861 RepID=A0A106BM20_THIDE|nr:CapA family protein [Thiobacillus denitrificans]KVW94961.1 poly-gamma-glutamate biosynthesis protein [Thiobacillus denitrificans]
MIQATEKSEAGARDMTLFLCGDVMTGRGIDQVLPHPGDPVLHEGYATSALDYVALAERANGPVPRPVEFAYVWGDALAEWARIGPDLRIVNLETAVTTRDDWQRGKGIHYRMHPANVPCLTAAAIDCCVLANNHVLDWGHAGLAETLETLRCAGLQTAGAGRDKAEAAAPAVLSVTGKGRVLVFSFGAQSSGIPPGWAAAAGQPGVNLLPDFSPATLRQIAAQVEAIKRPADVVVVSLHWGGNWGYAVPAAHQRFAHGLIDQCGVDVVHGHSSHHPLGIEVYRGRPILYGCGDFLNDYEGIAGYEAYRGDLSLMYFLTIDAAGGTLLRLRMIPMQTRRFRLNRASAADTRWLRGVLDRAGRHLGSRVEAGPGGSLALRW